MAWDRRTFLKKYLGIITILIGTLLLRLFRINELTTFGGDLGYDLLKIRDILNGDLTLLGSPIGRFGDITLYLGPLYYYLEAPFLLISRSDPIGVTISLIFVRVLTTFIIYLITKRLFGIYSAILAAIISSLSPYWVNSLGSPSPAYLVLLTTSATILLVERLDNISSGPPKKYLLACFALGFLSAVNSSFHYLGLISLPALLFFLVYGTKRAKLKSLASLSLGFFLALSPIILFEIRNNFFLTSLLVNQLSAGVIPMDQNSFYEKIKIALEYLTIDTIGFWIPSTILLLLVAIIGFQILKSPPKLKRVLSFLASILILNIIGATIYFGQVKPHYLASSYPVYFIFAGFLIHKSRIINKYLPLVLIIIISLSLIKANNFTSTSGYTMPEDLTLKEIRKISKIVANDANVSFNITSTLDGDSRAMPYRYLVSVYGKEPQDVENYNNIDSLYVITRDPSRVVKNNNLFEIASFQPSHLSKVWEITGDIHLIKLSKKENPQLDPEKFITIINPVRSRDLWPDPSINHLESQVRLVKESNLTATWLLTYDNLFDPEVMNLLKNLDPTQEIGAFLEVSQKWATDSGVSYKISDGDYYRPDKVFLSGYFPSDRKKLIETYFKTYSQKFGENPRSVGAWYIDSYSQSILSKKGVILALTVADQYDTDAAKVWGKYFSYPFYPSKYNSIEPAGKMQTKIPIVNIQWAQRDPVAGYGQDVKSSRESFQANDYINNFKGHSYFVNLLKTYLTNKDTDFIQITIGLEAGQEAVTFFDEYRLQLENIRSLVEKGEVKAVKASDFANWYQKTYPGISPAHFLQKDASFWFMSPKFRVAIFKEKNHFYIKDLRYYSVHLEKDGFYQDKEKYLSKEVPAEIDSLRQNNQIDLGVANNLEIQEKFDRIILNLESSKFEINTNGVISDGTYLIEAPQRKDHAFNLYSITLINFSKNWLKTVLNPLKFSKIAKDHIYGFAIGDTKLIGFKGQMPGIFFFDFQTLSKFKSPAQVVEKWQPWID